VTSGQTAPSLPSVRRHGNASARWLEAEEPALLGKHNEEVQLCAFDVLAMDGHNLRRLPLSMRKANLARLLRSRPDRPFRFP
jgi:ATP-dependent DNA ligase